MADLFPAFDPSVLRPGGGWTAIHFPVDEDAEDHGPVPQIDVDLVIGAATNPIDLAAMLDDDDPCHPIAAKAAELARGVVQMCRGEHCPNLVFDDAGVAFLCDVHCKKVEKGAPAPKTPAPATAESDSYVLIYSPFGLRWTQAVGAPSLAILSDETYFNMRCIWAALYFGGNMDNDRAGGFANGGLKICDVFNSVTADPLSLTCIDDGRGELHEHLDERWVAKAKKDVECMVAAAIGVDHKDMRAVHMTAFMADSGGSKRAIRQFLHTDMDTRRCDGDSSGVEFVSNPERSKGTIFSVLLTITGEAEYHVGGEPNLLRLVRKGEVLSSSELISPDRDPMLMSRSNDPMWNSGGTVRNTTRVSAFSEAPWIAESKLYGGKPASGTARIFSSYAALHAGVGSTDVPRAGFYVEVMLHEVEFYTCPQVQQVLPWTAAEMIFPPDTEGVPSQEVRVVRAAHLVWSLVEKERFRAIKERAKVTAAVKKRKAPPSQSKKSSQTKKAKKANAKSEASQSDAAAEADQLPEHAQGEVQVEGEDEFDSLAVIAVAWGLIYSHIAGMKEEVDMATIRADMDAFCNAVVEHGPEPSDVGKPNRWGVFKPGRSHTGFVPHIIEMFGTPERRAIVARNYREYMAAALHTATGQPGLRKRKQR